MKSKITYILGFIITALGIFWLRGPATEAHEYFFAVVVIVVGILVVWFGNKGLFKKDTGEK